MGREKLSRNETEQSEDAYIVRGQDGELTLSKDNVIEKAALWLNDNHSFAARRNDPTTSYNVHLTGAKLAMSKALQELGAGSFFDEKTKEKIKQDAVDVLSMLDIKER